MTTSRDTLKSEAELLSPYNHSYRMIQEVTLVAEMHCGCKPDDCCSGGEDAKAEHNDDGDLGTGINVKVPQEQIDSLKESNQEQPRWRSD